MNQELIKQFERLHSFIISAGFDFPLGKGARLREINRIQRKTGIKLTDDIASFYRLMDGSDHEIVFAVNTDELIPCEYLSLKQAMKSWSFSDSNPEQYIERINRQYKEYSQSPPRDKRINQGIWANLGWFPFGEFNGGATKIYLDMDPTEFGKAGQIIAYQHDPDAMYYVASNFLTFLKASNDLLEKNLEELFLR